MGNDNREVMRTAVQKADLTVADMTTNGGVLLPAQAKQFLEIMIDDTVILKDVAVKPMSAPVQEFDKVGFLSRIARGGVEGQSLSAADRVAPTTQKFTLTSVELKAQVNLTSQDLEDNIEGDTFADTVKRLMAERFALDIEDLVVNGDVTSSDALLKKNEGLLKLATTNVVDKGVTALVTGHFYDLLKGLPSAFQKDKAALRFYTSPKGELKWRDIYGARATVGGDGALTSAAPIPAYGVKVVAVPVIPTNLGVGTNETNILLCDPKNIAVGFWKQVTIKTQEDIDAGVYKIVARVRMDVEYQHEPAVAKAIKITT